MTASSTRRCGFCNRQVPIDDYGHGLSGACSDRWPCCGCCDEGPFAAPGACSFNVTRDRHAGPCDECEKPCPCCGDVHPKVAAS